VLGEVGIAPAALDALELDGVIRRAPIAQPVADR
jgi:hypothetical protein